MFTDFKYEQKGDQVNITGQCRITHKPYSLTVPYSGFVAYYREGKYIQEAFPDLPKEQREYLVSGFSPEGWAKIFGNELEEEEVICLDHWHCDPALAVHMYTTPDRSKPCPTCGVNPSVVGATGVATRGHPDGMK